MDSPRQDQPRDRDVQVPERLVKAGFIIAYRIRRSFLIIQDDIKLLFELFPMRFVRRVWEDRMAGQGAYLYSLNMMIAQYYFNIRNPKAFLHKKELEQVKKMQEDGI